MSRDPKEEAGSNNLYLFVYNCPLYFIDPFGADPIKNFIVSLANVLDKSMNAAVDILGWNDPELATRLQSGVQWQLESGFSCKESYWLKQKKNNKQVPFAIGLNFELLGVWKPMWFESGMAAGIASAYTFFPDSCELAMFAIKTTSVTGRSKVYPSIDEFEGRNGKTMADYHERVPKENWWESGAFANIEANIEFATYVGNTTPGIATAQSFTGVSHTVESGIGISFAGYMGEEDANGGKWMGGTMGWGFPIGLAKIGWKYELVPPVIGLEKEYGEKGLCFCHLLIELLLP